MAVTETLYIIAAVLVGALASARLTRLITTDSWPPSVWLREKWAVITEEGPWYDLVECPWCASPWIVMVNLMVALTTDLHAVWWIFNGWMAASLVVAWVTIKAGD